ncbi:hypothetical protein WICPIJ_004719 [Wickerhamomyces pijperi]|uniref:Mitochondrial outer membrane protein OM14 C-terminal domain-containing protein n=1 Tax=Wickerhamomyces pijperi TaxID=599730 RepID=A0A9P8Q7H7_WICPI|nr:hypothetical protein WICPIJ_004719 [Wickerhamomyces pijperi]
MANKKIAEEAGKAAEDIKKDVKEHVDEASNSQTAKDLKKDADEFSAKAKDTLQNVKESVNSTIDDVKKELPKYKEEAKKKEKEIADKLKKDYDQSKSYLASVFNSLSEKLSNAGSYVYSQASNFTVVAKEELKNPVVLTQTVVALAAIPALVVGVQERSKIFGGKTDTEISLILSGLIGIVALDGLLFSNYYPKYGKSSKKV